MRHFSQIQGLYVRQSSGATLRLLTEAFRIEHGRTGVDDVCGSEPLFLMNVSLPENSAIQNFQIHTLR